MTKFGYMRVSKADGSQTTALQLDALIKEGVVEKNIYSARLPANGTPGPV